MKWIQLVGNNYEVGFQLGQWWGKELKRLASTFDGFTFLNSKEGEYVDWLSNSWNEQYLPLFRNTLHYFPEVIEEISGLSEGARESGFHTSLLDMFVMAIGETEVPTHNCSSFVINDGDRIILGHNEEDSRKHPLCFADVRLKTKNKQSRFMSVSHPFQLFGSAAGLTRQFSFQGNSIGYSKQKNKLYQTWQSRIPNTVFSRKMLDAHSMVDIETLFETYHTTMPNHHYVCFSKVAYSLEVRPVKHPKRTPARSQLTVKKVTGKYHAMTNHFIQKGSIDKNWQWEKLLKESAMRRDKLEKLLSTEKPISSQSAKKLLYELRSFYEKETGATLVFDMRCSQRSINGIYYFGDKEQEVEDKTIYSKKRSLGGSQ